jgi:hypothetical protein
METKLEMSIMNARKVVGMRKRGKSFRRGMEKKPNKEKLRG